MTRLAMALYACTSATAPAAQAHVPNECIHLFYEAGRQHQDFLQRMEVVFDEIMDTTEFEYGYLADLFAQAYGAYPGFALSLSEAIECLQSEE